MEPGCGDIVEQVMVNQPCRWLGLRWTPLARSSVTMAANSGSRRKPATSPSIADAHRLIAAATTTPPERRTRCASLSAILVTSGVGNVLHRPGQNAELVSLRVCENSPRGVSRLTDVGWPGAHRHEPLDFFLRCGAISA